MIVFNLKKKFILVWTYIFLFIGTNINAQNKAHTDMNVAEIRQTESGYRIFLNDEPFFVKGIGGGSDSNFKVIADHGANTIRTWSTDNGKELLDKAHAHGLKVLMGIWLVPERHGADYNNLEEINAQYDRIKKEVLALKDYPALLCWIIGNELNQDGSNPNVWNAVNDISKMIHELSPNQLTTTAIAGFEKTVVKEIEKRAPDLDFLSVQLYGAMDVFSEILLQTAYKGPLLITEWGTTGYWEVEKTTWGAPLEDNSSIKADAYLSRYQNGIENEPQVMGSAVFLWGHKQERTPTWFGMHLKDGAKTESVDAMHYAWTGKWPHNRTPRLHSFTLDGQKGTDNIKLKPGARYTAEIMVIDPENDNLTYRWEVMEESKTTQTGGDREKVPPVIDGLLQSNDQNSISFKAPLTIGAYRLYVYVYDQHHSAAHANIPFFVEN